MVPRHGNRAADLLHMSDAGRRSSALRHNSVLRGGSARQTRIVAEQAPPWLAPKVRPSLPVLPNPLTRCPVPTLPALVKYLFLFRQQLCARLQANPDRAHAELTTCMTS